MKKCIYPLCVATAAGYAATILGNSTISVEMPEYFNLYALPALLFYVGYFIDKYFFRLFLSISKTRAALGAGIINVVCAFSVVAVLYFFAHLMLNEAVCLMSVPDIYCLARFHFQGMPFIPFAAAFGGLVLLKLFLFMHVFEERKSWIAPLIVLVLSRVAQLGILYGFMRNLPTIIDFGLAYMSLKAFLICIFVSVVLVDYLCSLFFKGNQEEF